MCGSGAVDDANITEVVDFDIIGLNHAPTPLRAGVGPDAALAGLARDRRYVIADFLRLARIADSHRAYSGVESIRIHAVRSTMRNVDRDFKAAYAVQP